MSDLEAALHKDMVAIYHEADHAVNYRPTQFLRMVEEHGAQETARRLLASEQVSDGFTRLYLENRLDLTVEALVLKPAYASLFTVEERTRAREWLEEAGYTPPWLLNGGGSDASPQPAADSTADTPDIGITGAEAGMSGQEQIRIALQAMADQGGEATIQQVYDALGAALGADRQLSQQGKDSLRSFINRDAKNKAMFTHSTASIPSGVSRPRGAPISGWLTRMR
jgi:hypothetical protein